MNNAAPLYRISNREELITERLRLQEEIRLQKLIIQNDVAELKAEVKIAVRPVTDTARFIKKFTAPEARYHTLLQLGAATMLDVLIRRLFARSPLLVQLVVPTLLKNFSTRAVLSLLNTLEQKRKNNQTDQNTRLLP